MIFHKHFSRIKLQIWINTPKTRQWNLYQHNDIFFPKKFIMLPTGEGDRSECVSCSNDSNQTMLIWWWQAAYRSAQWKKQKKHMQHQTGFGRFISLGYWAFCLAWFFFFLHNNFTPMLKAKGLGFCRTSHVCNKEASTGASHPRHKLRFLSFIKEINLP